MAEDHRASRSALYVSFQFRARRTTDGSRNHPVDASRNLYEVKSGRSGPLDFLWFAKSLPKRSVLAIGNGEFQSAVAKGITIEQFLLADGFPHPYPGQVDNPDIYNEYGRFF